MSEQHVIKLLGEAKRSDLSTCGQAVGTPWRCKTWDYGDLLGQGLSITFHETAGGWVVVSWNSRADLRPGSSSK
jgi:hypothetical protein